MMISQVLKHSNIIVYADGTVLYFSHKHIKNIEVAMPEDIAQLVAGYRGTVSAGE